MSSYSQSAIIWPEKFLPGTTDNFVSNEIIVKDITAAQIWPLLADITKWESYYENCSQITPPPGNILKKGEHFKFSTFGFPVLPCTVEESEEPTKGRPGRVAWSASLDGDEDSKVSVYHAWLVEDIDHDRVRILTQESQTGKPAAELSTAKPNKMLLGHQDWLDGLVNAAKGGKVKETNLSSAGLS
ncbi:hypothetical protein AMS68_006883 [Peltaster fructicola]|uniref:Coenzyme Q-binding protein COQ10 START domain-containing protein n=1 Tax=Peltaster fructicola TaxID=286661 RepID=A0A6H0Y334_9PEZI|nr:hypothetical protein AMS68_006883 [Peltaster fructicola]